MTHSAYESALLKTLAAIADYAARLPAQPSAPVAAGATQKQE